jgi:ornithine cyclodeaminase/alanine dehydrogenase
MSAPVHLSDAVLADLGITPDEMTDAIEEALIAKAEGRLLTTPKSALLPSDGRYMMSTLATGDAGVTVLKAVGVYPGNAARGLPAITGAILVLDAGTGELRALMGADWITANRTAGLSAVAARRLADPGSETLAFVGCGVQASSHLSAFNTMFPLKKVLAVGRGKANLERLCAEARALGLEAEASEAEPALRAADIVVTSVTLDYSIPASLDAGWLKPNAFAAITDLFIPWHDASHSAFSQIVVDDLEQERTAPKPMVPFDAIDTDLTGLVTRGGAKGNGPRAFVFRGIALGDYAAAALALQRAESLGRGSPIA